MRNKLVGSFGYAFEGVVKLVASQLNAKIHLVFTILTICLGLFLGLSGVEWSLVLLVIALVWLAEAMNTAIEELANVVTTELTPGIKAAKDIAAAGVLISAIVALLVGGIVFLPHLMG